MMVVYANNRQVHSLLHSLHFWTARRAPGEVADEIQICLPKPQTL